MQEDDTWEDDLAGEGDFKYLSGNFLLYKIIKGIDSYILIKI